MGLPDRRNALGERKPCPIKVHKKEDLVTVQLQLSVLSHKDFVLNRDGTSLF